MEINIKITVGMDEYGKTASPEEATKLGLALVRGEANWPQFVEISVTRDPYRTTRYDVYAS